jgi:hypothetical protein
MSTPKRLTDLPEEVLEEIFKYLVPEISEQPPSTAAVAY